MASDFLSSPRLSPSNRSNTVMLVIRFLSAPRAARTSVLAGVSLSMMKAKSRFTGCRSVISIAPFERLLLRLSGIASRSISQATTGPFRSSSFKVAGCSSPNMANVFFGPSRITPERPGWYHGGASGLICNWASLRPNWLRTLSTSAFAS